MKGINKTLFNLNWNEILKSHKYSRKEFKNGKWIYYYDKHNNFERITVCHSQPLSFDVDSSLDDNIQAALITDKAIDYIDNVWLKDWEEHPEKAICKELRNKKIVFSDISYTHIWKQGGNSIGGAKIRDSKNIIHHIKYFPCAKELLEKNGIWTEARYEKLNFPFLDKNCNKKVVATVYQTITGLNPDTNSKNKYICVTLTKRKYEDGTYSDTVYISVDSKGNIKKSMNKTSCFFSAVNDKASPIGWGFRLPRVNNNTIPKKINKIVIQNITESNRAEKIKSLRKSLTVRKGMNISFGRIIDSEFIEKAVRKLSFALDAPLQTTKGEGFFYKAQEDLTNRYIEELTKKTSDFYSWIIDYFGLPEIRILSKANLMHKGKILYNPETGKPITDAEWKKFVDSMEKFLNRNYNGIGQRIILDSQALGRILDRMLVTNSLEAVQKQRLDGLKFKGRTFDWISQDIKNMKDTFGNSFDREMQSRIMVASQSAAQRITKVTSTMRNDMAQIIIDGVKNKESKSVISQHLFDKCVGLNRDFQRIADTEIQNTVNEAYINEEVHNTPEGEKIYFKRYEILDDNTCKKCAEMKGKIVLWSDSSLPSQKIKDPYADHAIWEGSGLLDTKNGIPEGTLHPFCRGSWYRYYPDADDFFKD